MRKYLKKTIYIHIGIKKYRKRIKCKICTKPNSKQHVIIATNKINNKHAYVRKPKHNTHEGFTNKT